MLAGYDMNIMLALIPMGSVEVCQDVWKLWTVATNGEQRRHDPETMP